MSNDPNYTGMSGGQMFGAGGERSKPTPREQHLRNEVGQLTHSISRMIRQREEMQSDLLRQRQDMTAALSLLEMGTLRDAMRVLKDGLAYRERTREKRKGKSGD